MDMFSLSGKKLLILNIWSLAGNREVVGTQSGKAMRMPV